jgi:hypothetical protein
MISIENKFIFTHIGRTGGGSIENALIDYGSKKPHKSPYFLNNPKIVEFEASQHWTSIEEKRVLGDKIWKQCFKFTIVRNPWDRIVSQYKGHVIKEVPGLSFEQYLYKSFVEKISHDDLRFIQPCMDWITDEDGNMLVEHIGRFETLQEDFDIICEILKIPKTILPHINKDPNKEHYKNYYTPELVELIAEAFEKDIKQFNYEF